MKSAGGNCFPWMKPFTIAQAEASKPSSVLQWSSSRFAAFLAAPQSNHCATTHLTANSLQFALHVSEHPWPLSTFCCTLQVFALGEVKVDSPVAVLFGSVWGALPSSGWRSCHTLQVWQITITTILDNDVHHEQDHKHSTRMCQTPTLRHVLFIT